MGCSACCLTCLPVRGLGTVGDLLLYMLTVTAAPCWCRPWWWFIPLLLKAFTGLSPWPFLRKMRTVQMFAFSTATSSATIPGQFLRNAEQRLGVDNRVAVLL